MEITVLNSKNEIRLTGARLAYRSFEDADKYVGVIVDDPECEEVLQSMNYYLRYPEIDPDKPDNYRYPTFKIHIKYRTRTGEEAKRLPVVHRIERGPDGEVEVDEEYDENTIKKLQNAHITSCTMDIRQWEYKPGEFSAYINVLYVECETDFYARMYGRR